MTTLVLALSGLMLSAPLLAAPGVATAAAQIATGDKTQAATPQRRYEAVEGTKVSLIRPEGFTPAEHFPGFEEAGTGVSVMVTEMAAPFSEVAAGLTEEKFRSRGVQLLSRHSVDVDGHPGLLLHMRQTPPGQEAAEATTFLKWMVVFGDEAEMVMILATFPERLERERSQLLRETVLGTKWEPERQVDPFSGLTFAVEGTEGLRFANRMQNTLLYTHGGIFPAPSAEGPLFIVGPALAEVEVADRKQFAEARIAQTSDTQILSVESNREIRIDGLSGYETIARALDAESRAPTVIYQVLLFEGDTYYLMQGLVGASLRDEYLDEFKKIARSFRRK